MKYKITIITKSWHEKIYEEDYIQDAIAAATKESQEKSPGKVVSIRVDELSTQPSQEYEQ